MGYMATQHYSIKYVIIFLGGLAPFSKFISTTSSNLQTGPWPVLFKCYLSSTRMNIKNMILLKSTMLITFKSFGNSWTTPSCIIPIDKTLPQFLFILNVKTVGWISAYIGSQLIAWKSLSDLNQLCCSMKATVNQNKYISAS